MFRFFLAGFVACPIYAEIWFLIAKHIHSPHPVENALNFVQYNVIALWMIAGSREVEPKASKWWSALAGWIFGTAVLIGFLMWRQPKELLFEFLRLGITVLLIFFAHWLRRRNESQSKPK